MKKILSMMLVILQFTLLPISSFPTFAETNLRANALSKKPCDNCIDFLASFQNLYGSWYSENDKYVSNIIFSLNYIKNTVPNYSDSADILVSNANDFLCDKGYMNIDMLSQYLLSHELRDSELIFLLCNFQNPDGGFGLALRLLFAK